MNSQQEYIKEYQGILARGDISCPQRDEHARKKDQRGRLKALLLERLRDYQGDVFRFMVSDIAVPFTNNQGDNYIRMTEVQQKISGCFRSIQGAEMFCLI
ncbi:IS66 family transposase [Oceanisphaera ostreae]|uniref:Transposase n=1 Tax=Oceanisphaera ostreae TaxID=914151 RepID=A0ABW3KFS7_9GAMM